MQHIALSDGFEAAGAGDIEEVVDDTDSWVMGNIMGDDDDGDCCDTAAANGLDDPDDDDEMPLDLGWKRFK